MTQGYYCLLSLSSCHRYLVNTFFRPRLTSIFDFPYCYDEANLFLFVPNVGTVEAPVTLGDISGNTRLLNI
jgi:hypothetical protein